jgi:hypothetical protein
MAKSKRSKVKMAYKAMRRRVMEPEHDARLREQSAKVYQAIGLPLPEERAEVDVMRERSHGGSVLVTTFHPTEKGPKLNVVHGPLANRDPLLLAAAPVVGLPIVGAGLEARMRSDLPADPAEDDAEVMDDGALASPADGYGYMGKPFFYPRRAKKNSSGVAKRKSTLSRHPQNKAGVVFR